MLTETKADLRQAVLNQLGKGKSQAIPGKLLAQRLREKDTRKIRLSRVMLIQSQGRYM